MPRQDMTSLDLTILCRLARDNNEAAASEVCERFWQMFRNKCKKRQVPIGQDDDVLQEIAGRVAKSLKSKSKYYEGMIEEEIGAYIAAIADNTITDHLKKLGKASRNHYELPGAEEVKHAPDFSNDVHLQELFKRMVLASWGLAEPVGSQFRVFLNAGRSQGWDYTGDELAALLEITRIKAYAWRQDKLPKIVDVLASLTFLHSRSDCRDFSDLRRVAGVDPDRRWAKRLTPEAHSAVKEHVKSCKPCRAEWTKATSLSAHNLPGWLVGAAAGHQLSFPDESGADESAVVDTTSARSGTAPESPPADMTPNAQHAVTKFSAALHHPLVSTVVNLAHSDAGRVVAGIAAAVVIAISAVVIVAQLPSDQRQDAAAPTTSAIGGSPTVNTAESAPGTVGPSGSTEVPSTSGVGALSPLSPSPGATTTAAAGQTPAAISQGPDLVANSGFDQASGATSTGVSGGSPGQGVDGTSAAANWALRNNSNGGDTTTQLLASTGPSGGMMLRFCSTQSLNNVFQYFAEKKGIGPVDSVAEVWINVESGKAGAGIGDGGSTSLTKSNARKGTWELLHVDHNPTLDPRSTPATEIVIGSLEPNTCFLVDSATVRARS